MSLNDRNGNYIRTVRALDTYYEPYNDITSIDANTIAVSIGSCISIITINTHKIVQKIKNGYRVCHGCTHCDGKLYYCSFLEGIRQFDLKTNTNQLLVKTLIGKFGYVSCHRNKLVYTSSTETVNYHKRDIKMNHTELWNVVKIIWLQDKKEETYFELYFIYSYLFINERGQRAFLKRLERNFFLHYVHNPLCFPILFVHCIVA
jgi:hypothetical protein